MVTAGPPARVVLDSSRPALSPAFDAAAFVTARLVDANGVTTPNAASTITFSVTGPGALAALDNGDVTNHASYQSNQCIAAYGKCLAVVTASAAGGAVSLKASVPGLPEASISIATRAGFGFEVGAALSAAPGSIRADQPFLFTADLPEGNYNVTVTFGSGNAAVTTVKSELRRLMPENVGSAAGASVTRTFTVNLRKLAAGGVKLKAPREVVFEASNWNLRLTLEFNGSQPSVRTRDIVPVKVPTLFLLGGSTVSDQPSEPYASWVQQKGVALVF